MNLHRDRLRVDSSEVSNSTNCPSVAVIRRPACSIVCVKSWSGAVWRASRLATLVESPHNCVIDISCKDPIGCSAVVSEMSSRRVVDD
jgi:hypothetical protein